MYWLYLFDDNNLLKLKMLLFWPRQFCRSMNNLKYLFGMVDFSVRLWRECLLEILSVVGESGRLLEGVLGRRKMVGCGEWDGGRLAVTVGPAGRSPSLCP